MSDTSVPRSKNPPWSLTGHLIYCLVYQIPGGDVPNPTPHSGRNVQSSSDRVSLTDSIRADIRDRIVFADIPAGEILVEARLAKAYSVSKTPVREALGLLSQEGLIEVLPRIGYRVVPVGIHDVHEVFHLRFLLEPEAAVLAARRGAEADILDLRQHSRRELDWLSKQDRLSLEAYVRFHDAFHLGVASLSGSKRLTRFIRLLLRDSTRVRISDPWMGVEGLAEDRETTEQMTGVLLARDEAGARRLMEEHLTSSKTRILDRFNDPESQAQRGQSILA